MYILDDDGKDLLATVKEFCEKEVKEQCKEYDVTGEWPKEIYDKATEMGLGCLEVPEEYGGLGLDKTTIAALYEEMSKADAGFFTTMSASNLAMKPLLIAGRKDQIQRAADILLEGGYGAFCLTEPMAGSDASNNKTVAVKDGDDYIINGRKCFITNGGVADFYIVTAMTDKSKGVKGMSAFFVEKGTPGLSSGNEENKMGIRTSNTTDVVFEDMRVPASAMVGEEGKGFVICMETLDITRALMGIGATGIMQRCVDEAVAYSKQRITFGQPIGKFEAIQFMIADMEIKTETARQMSLHAMQLQEQGLPYSKESAIAKCYAGDAAVQVALDAIQILGGYGYSREYPVEKLLRDAKIFQIYEGTNQVQRMVISRAVMGKF